jgi:predicted RecA/RadA family phage recombinase
MKTFKTVSLIALAMLAVVSVAAQAAGFDIGTVLSPETAMGLSMVGAAGMINFAQEGDVLTLTPAAAVSSGQGYLFGTSLFGVATNAVASGVSGEFLTEGVVDIAKTSALAISVGDRVYWDPAAKVVNKTATAQQCVGIAVAAAINPSATVLVKLGCYTAVAA